MLYAYGHHASVCPTADGAVRRHNNLRDRVISIIAKSPITLNLWREWTFPQDSSSATGSIRRLDLYIEDSSFAPGAKVFDVTVISPHSQPYASVSVPTNGFALIATERAKWISMLLYVLSSI